jgi:hypothetical protein
VWVSCVKRLGCIIFVIRLDNYRIKATNLKFSYKRREGIIEFNVRFGDRSQDQIAGNNLSGESGETVLSIFH